MIVSTLLRPILVGITALMSAGCNNWADREHPNVILIMIDTLRADHLSHYGYDQPTAPALDAFRAQSTLFSQCYSPAPWTGPSTASLFTGLFTARHRTNAHGARLPDEAITLAESLSARGWHTFGISFNHEISRKTGFDQGFHRFEEPGEGVVSSPDIEEMVSLLTKWLAKNPEEPFFLYIQPMNVHGPYHVPRLSQSILLGRPPSRAFAYQDLLMNEIMYYGKIESREKVTEEYVTSLIEQYDTAIRYTTDKLAEIFGLLKKRNLYDKSVIILTADHGEELFEHGGVSHAFSLHREVLHVPLYIKLPYQSAGGTVASPVSLRDVYPTIMETVGIGTEHAIDGKSLLPLLRGDPKRGDDETAEPRLHQTAWKKRCVARAIVSGQYKLIDIKSNYEGLRDVKQLYDIVADPGEERDLAPQKSNVATQLQREMDERFARYERGALPEPLNVLDEMDEEKLKALGYVDGQ